MTIELHPLAGFLLALTGLCFTTAFSVVSILYGQMDGWLLLDILLVVTFTCALSKFWEELHDDN